MAENLTDLNISRLGTVPRPESETSFDETLAQLQAATGARGQPLTPIARVIGMQEAALLTYRMEGYGDSNQPGVQEVLLAGERDPAKFQLQDGVYRLLKLAVKGRSRPNYLDLALFFKSSSEPSCRSCIELAELFQKKTGAHDLEVQVRMDTWFDSMWFPLFFRFEPDNQPVVHRNVFDRIVAPKVAQYYRMSHVICRWSSGGLSCEKYGRCEYVR